MKKIKERNTEVPNMTSDNKHQRLEKVLKLRKNKSNLFEKRGKNVKIEEDPEKIAENLQNQSWLKLYTERRIPKNTNDEESKGFLSRRIFHQKSEEKLVSVENLYSKFENLKTDPIENSGDKLMSIYKNNNNNCDEKTHTASKKFLNNNLVIEDNEENGSSVKTKKNEKYALTRTLNSLMKNNLRINTEKSVQFLNHKSSKNSRFFRKIMRFL